MKYYCLTIRKCSISKTLKSVEKCLEQYIFILDQLKKQYVNAELEYHFETVIKDTGLNVHVHAMIKSRTESIFIKPRKGYSIKLEPCCNREAWITYITKSPKTKQQVLRQWELFSSPEKIITTSIDALAI